MTADEQVEALADWLAIYLSIYTLPANYGPAMYGQTHRSVAENVAPVIVEHMTTSPAFRAIVAAERAAAWDEAAALAEQVGFDMAYESNPHRADRVTS